ncbi:hypothetical protein ACI6QG_15785 [Roseococcus sp. DSY-14]|uniref:hypothetical protein n=1 Tax=Roseococcus sp. DSY-14 TaxID=3369650 RepID=UPI00387ADC12
MSGQAQGGLFGSPASLAAGAAGACSALCMLWALRGLPLGGLLLWATPLPLLLAGLSFGARAAAYAAAAAGLAMLLLGPLLGFAIHAVAFGLPAALLVALATAGSRLRLSLPLAALGLWPLAALLLLAAFVPDLEGAMREAVEMGVQRMGLDLPEGMIVQVAQVKAAAAGFWLVVVMVLNALLAQLLLRRWGLAGWETPSLSEARLPGWYLPLPALAFGAWLALGGAVALSALLILLVPLFLLGVLSVHARARGKRALLAGFWVLMLVFLQVMAPLMVGLGLYEQIRRRAAPPQT